MEERLKNLIRVNSLQLKKMNKQLKLIDLHQEGELVIQTKKKVKLFKGEEVYLQDTLPPLMNLEDKPDNR